MDIQFYGANCVIINTKSARLVIDDNLSELGGKSVTKTGDIVLYTAAHGDTKNQPKIVIDQPGEYEVSGVTVYGIAARLHIDEDDSTNSTLYKIIYDEIKVLITGHIYPELSDRQLEAIGTVDVLVIPVGGNGYTLDGVGALAIIKEIEPKIVIPTHYDNPKLKFPVPQSRLEDALKSLGMEPREPVNKLKVKTSELSETTQLAIIEQSA
jgi:L-ascorbate metabolism protein UlaG (beta-lactamase superfamily)